MNKKIDDTIPDHLYRKGVGIVLINKDRKIFVGKRIDSKFNAWQMPQGGIDVGENEDIALFREVKEETGINKSNIHILAKSNQYYYYNLPYKLQKKFWGGKYLGQKQRWYAANFIGRDSDINISTQDPEFCQWQWINHDKTNEFTVEFKREMYQNIFDEFAQYLKK